MRIYLVGYMASGKTWLGQELALATGLEFVDIDDLFENRFRITISDFFGKYGEELFRKLEHEILEGTLELGNVVIATGGGTPCFYNNMDLILSSGKSVYLRMDLTELIDRIQTIKKKRPLLMNLESSGLKDFVRDQLQEREQYYLKADWVFDGPDYPIEEICRVLGLK